MAKASAKTGLDRMLALEIVRVTEATAVAAAPALAARRCGKTGTEGRITLCTVFSATRASCSPKTLE